MSKGVVSHKFSFFFFFFFYKFNRCPVKKKQAVLTRLSTCKIHQQARGPGSLALLLDKDEVVAFAL